MIPLLDGEVITVDLPGHGSSTSNDYSWAGIWATIMNCMERRSWWDTVLVLHSFTASLLPEIVSSGVRPKKIVLVEGIIHSDDAILANNLSAMDLDFFNQWFVRFRSVSRMALKSQLISKHSDNKIDEWSNSFKVVRGMALRIMAINLKKRLDTDGITNAFTSSSIPIVYIRGEFSRLSLTGKYFLQQNNVEIRVISKSAHFPMIDNPGKLSELMRL